MIYFGGFCPDCDRLVVCVPLTLHGDRDDLIYSLDDVLTTLRYWRLDGVSVLQLHDDESRAVQAHAPDCATTKPRLRVEG